ncbi:hypothetical protein HELRODRAFT_144297, partial [Helobdella robusta]|uniref:Uncharacterized protein n=1 Tax=Helobdella robusta TaxID=6412 RepID=T1EJE2_HELRO
GNVYWRLNDRISLDEGYPKSIKVWDGIEVPIDAAYSDIEDNVYFFKGKRFWKMFSTNLSVMPGYPKLIGKDWLSCD